MSTNVAAGAATGSCPNLAAGNNALSCSFSDPPVLERELVRALKTMTRSDAQAIDLIKDIERRLAELRRFDALRRI